MKLAFLLLISGMLFGQYAFADIYKRIDKDGHVTYSSEPLKGGKKIYLKPLPVVPSGGRNSRSGEGRAGEPSDFPKVDTQTQKRRDNTRRLILEDELKTETDALASAREILKSLEDEPELIVKPTGLPNPNAAQYQEKLKAAQKDIGIHEQNIKALQTELSNLKQ